MNDFWSIFPGTLLGVIGGFVFYRSLSIYQKAKEVYKQASNTYKEASTALNDAMFERQNTPNNKPKVEKGHIGIKLEEDKITIIGLEGLDADLIDKFPKAKEFISSVPTDMLPIMIGTMAVVLKKRSKS